MNVGFLPAVGWLAAAAFAPGPDIKDRGQVLEVQPLRILALGDSYTIGESVEHNERWPNQLAARLRADGIPTDTPILIAQTGWTTGELKAGISATHIDAPYDLVSLLIGVNNQYRGLDPEVFVAEFAELLDIAIVLAGDDSNRVFVLSIPDWGVTPFANGRDRDLIAREIDTYNDIKRAACRGRNVRFFDVTEFSRRAESEPRLLAADGLHPSGLMYGRWVESIAPEVAFMLRAESP